MEPKLLISERVSPTIVTRDVRQGTHAALDLV